jgi:hypothetical protein
MTVSKKSIVAANPSRNKDVAQFSGTVTFASGTTKLPGIVIVQFGSFAQSFMLVKGSAKVGTSQFRFTAKNGVLSAPVGFKIKLTGNLLAVLSKAGLTLGSNGSVSVPLRMVFFGTSNSADINLNFSIKASAKSERGN